MPSSGGFEGDRGGDEQPDELQNAISDASDISSRDGTIQVVKDLFELGTTENKLLKFVFEQGLRQKKMLELLVAQGAQQQAREQSQTVVKTTNVFARESHGRREALDRGTARGRDVSR